MTLPISVIIPCWKQEQWLGKAIESAIAQSDDISVVYDGNLSPSSLGIESHCTIFTTGGDYRAGVCYARNMGIDAALHELIFCLDADDRLYPDTLQRLYDAWQSGTWVYGDTYTEIDEQENAIAEKHNPPPGMLNRKNLTYASFLFHRDDWHKAGGYNPTFEFGDEDYAFQVALTAAGVRPVRIVGTPLYQRMIHQHSRTENAVKYFPMVLDMLRTKYPSVMHS